ncbi:carbohydrate kinase family protein [Patescibacteria group bacterium]|nr:carbohydrate kinase family protein [Patescibacteria group bacterium]MBU1673438.1 carbohydrate kinase family protein [Patescibacteria group bacterium]MBU1963361.1 carbohydrate kinase family protein [Patescibacteria group bacterium]
MKKFNVVTIGTAVRDVVFYTDEGEVFKNPKKDPAKLELLGFEHGAKMKSEDVYFTFGGGAANAAVNFSGLGLKTAAIAGVGDDMDGKDILLNLKKNKVDTSLIKTDKKNRSGLSFLTVDKNSNEHVVFVYYGANLTLNVNPADLNKFNTDWFYVSSIASPAWPQIMKAAAQTGSRIAWNPGATQLRSGFKKLANLLPNIEILLVNKDEATELILSKNPREKRFDIKSILKELFAWGPGIVVISDGRKGAWIYDGINVYFDKPGPQKPKDTTGAGDCFGSTFVGALHKTKYDFKKSIDLATKNASALVDHPGAQIGLLKWQKLIKTKKK